MALYKTAQCVDCGSPALDLAAKGSRTDEGEGKSGSETACLGGRAGILL